MTWFYEMQFEPPLPPRGTPERIASDARHAAMVSGLLDGYRRHGISTPKISSPDAVGGASRMMTAGVP
jgi:hypothetical protein